MRPDYCPISEDPCQLMCDEPCKLPDMGNPISPMKITANDELTPAEMRAGIALQLREIERLRVQVKQADERGDEAMRALRQAQDAIVAIVEDGFLYFGREGMSEAQKIVLAAYESISPPPSH